MGGTDRGVGVSRATSGTGPSSMDPVAWHTMSSETVVTTLGVDPGGITSAEAAERLRRYGPNQLPEDSPPSALVIFLHQFRSPLIYILLIAGAFTLLIGKYVDTVVIAAVLALNATIGFVQERQAERSVRALMHLVAAKAHVVRDGIEQEIEGADVVPGDLVLLESGRRVPADIRLASTTTLAIDESLLTGEIAAFGQGDGLGRGGGRAGRPHVARLHGHRGDHRRGRGHVVTTGVRTELGRIAELVRGEGVRVTPLQQRMTRFAHVIGAIVLVAALGTKRSVPPSGGILGSCPDLR